MVSRIPAYLSHSYGQMDRTINRLLWEVFWDAGFTFTVDPKSTEELSIPHLELMMKRSACFVAIAPYRANEEYYKTSPYIAFEHSMAVRAQKPRLVLAEARVARHPFAGTPVCVFRRDDPASAKDLPRMIEELRERSTPHAAAGDQLLGSVGLVLPPGRPYQRAGAAITEVLESAGYTVDPLRLDPTKAPEFSDIDRHAFMVIDVAHAMTSGLYYRFVPTIRLRYRSGNGHASPGNGFTDDPRSVISWRTQDELLAQLQPVVDKIERPRREFRSREEGIGYFQSVGRALQGPVFISNADRQNDVAQQLSRGLDLYNIAFFHYRYRNSIPMDAVWQEQVGRRLESSRLFVALISAQYRDSPVCCWELQRAEQLAARKRLRIYRYFLDKESADSDRQGRDLTGMSPDDQVRRIVGDVDDFLTAGGG